MTPPETIWTEPPDIFDGMGLWYDKPHPRLTEYRRADLVRSPAVKVKPLVYIASKAKYGQEWVAMRGAGYPFISTWIDQSGVGDTDDWPALWQACISEASQACALVLICRDGDILKGAWAEVGAALASNRLVFASGIDPYSIKHHPKVIVCASEKEAFAKAAAQADYEARILAALDLNGEEK